MAPVIEWTENVKAGKAIGCQKGFFHFWSINAQSRFCVSVSRRKAKGSAKFQNQ